MAKRPWSFERAFVSLPKRNRRLRLELSLILSIRRLAFVAVVVAIIPLAYASPADPSWIAGIYDADDYDDVVQLLSEISGTHDAPARESLTAVTEIVERIALMVQIAVYSMASGRSPPAAGPVVPETPVSLDHSPVTTQPRDLSWEISAAFITGPLAGWSITQRTPRSRQ